MPSFMEMLMTREEQMQCSGIAAHDMPHIPHDVIPTRDLPRTRQGRDVCVCVYYVGRCDGGVAVTRCKTNPDVFDMLVSCADFETFKGGLPVCRRE